MYLFSTLISVNKYLDTAVTAVRSIMDYDISMMSKEGKNLCIEKGLYVSPVY